MLKTTVTEDLVQHIHFQEKRIEITLSSVTNDVCVAVYYNDGTEEKHVYVSVNKYDLMNAIKVFV